MASKAISQCPDCGSGRLVQRPSGFHACADCGKLVVGPVELDLSLVHNRWVAEEPPASGPIADSDVVVPDEVGLLTGWRTWEVPTSVGDGYTAPFLRSVVYTDCRWLPGQATEAECMKKRNRALKTHHCPPVKACDCGLYAAKTREHLLTMHYHFYDGIRNGFYNVLGTVAMWGGYIEGTLGWRAEFAYPTEIFVPYEAWKLAAPLASAYGVPVKLNNFLGEFEE